MEAQDLVTLLNSYFEDVVVNTVLDNGGVVDKSV